MSDRDIVLRRLDEYGYPKAARRTDTVIYPLDSATVERLAQAAYRHMYGPLAPPFEDANEWIKELQRGTVNAVIATLIDGGTP